MAMLGVGQMDGSDPSKRVGTHALYILDTAHTYAHIYSGFATAALYMSHAPNKQMLTNAEVLQKELPICI
jgi:hypothetical protein